MQTAITAIGIATPAYTQSQAKVIEMMVKHLPLTKSEQRLLKTIYRHAGIHYRHSVLEDFIKSEEALTFFPNDPTLPYPSTQERMTVYKKNALTLALSAIRQCLQSQAVGKHNITHLITVSCTGMYAPGLDIEIVNAMALPTTTQRVTINFMGCYGTFNGLKAAQAICQADPAAKVLLVSIELCTIHFQKEATADNFISSAIFSDGAGALLIEKIGPNQLALALTDFYCDLLPEGKQEMTWDIGNFGFDIKLSSYVPDLIKNGIVKFVERLLARKALTLHDIDFYAIHPGGKKILEACEMALNISLFDNRFSYDVLKNYGNMSSATIVFVLKKMWDTFTKNDHNKKVFSCAFGPGLTLESMMLTVHHV